jgi:co-chaperonin GroES (HSP10)
MKLLNDRVLIKRYTTSTIDKDTGMEWRVDGDYLPRAEVIAISDELKMSSDKVNVPNVGDHVYYVEPREKGKIKFNEEDHFAIPFGSIVAII